MEDDFQLPRQHRTNFLFRRVVVWSWVQVVMMLVYASIVITLFITQPLYTLLLLGVSYVVIRYGYSWLQRRYKAEDATDGQEAASSTLWLRLRTYPVWYLLLLSLSFTMVIVTTIYDF